MQVFFLYAATVAIWGSTWLAIEFQLGDVPSQVSLFYRFALAAVLMWVLCAVRKTPLRFSRQNHLFFALQGIAIFCLNYVFLYWSQTYLTSAMACIAFSTLMIMNIVNARIIFGNRVANRIYVGAALGILGIISLFWDDVKALDFTSEAMTGLGLALVGTFSASMGNMVTVRNGKQKINVFASNTWGMSYGAVFLLLYVLFSGVEWKFDTSPAYVLSLLHLSVLGTVVGFACYFALFNRIGPEKTSYANVLFPVVAVILSTLYEGFQWHQNTLIGFALVMCGNLLVLMPSKQLVKLTRWLKPTAAKSAELG